MQLIKHIPNVKLYKRPDTGYYFAVWYESGKKHRESLKTKDERKARRKINQFIADMKADRIRIIEKGRKISFFGFCEEFDGHIKATSDSPETVRLYKNALDKAKATWGDIPLSHITTRLLDKAIQDMVAAGLARPTVNKNYRHLKSAIRKAMEWYPESFQRPIVFPKQLSEREVDRHIPQAGFKKIMAQIEDPEFFDFCALSIYTGLRSSEILRLQWDDIDQDRSTIRVRSEQKNRKDNEIPMNTHAAAILLQNCKYRGHKKPFRWNCRTHMSHLFKKAVRAAGYEDYRLHDLRHSFASYLAMDNKAGKSIQKLMRHKSFKSTERYMHLSPDHLKDVSESLNLGFIPRKAADNQD